MKKFAVSLIIILTSCISTNKKINNMEESNNKSKNSSTVDTTTPKVIGIGGIFFLSDDTKVTKEWYAKNLGIEMNAWGSSSFDSRDIEKPEVVNTLQWTPFKKDTDYFEPSKKEFMINYRVQNLEGLMMKLKENGVTILDTIATYDYGKFLHIMDSQGNKIELWEPIEN